jgi:hypothetical protein
VVAIYFVYDCKQHLNNGCGSRDCCFKGAERMSGYCPDCGNTLCVCNIPLTTTGYEVSVQPRFKWHVGYHPEHDEMFLYKIDADQVISIFRKGGLDSMGFYEFMDFSQAELLGEL